MCPTPLGQGAFPHSLLSPAREGIQYAATRLRQGVSKVNWMDGKRLKLEPRSAISPSRIDRRVNKGPKGEEYTGAGPWVKTPYPQ